MEIITTTITTTLVYTPTVALLELPDGAGTVAVVAYFSVADIWIIVFLALLLVVSLIRLFRGWRY